MNRFIFLLLADPWSAEICGEAIPLFRASSAKTLLPAARERQDQPV
jgi:hypothetical protein